MSIYPASPAGSVAWRISRTCESGACIGVARQGELVLVGNTSNPDIPISTFTVTEWQKFLEGAKLGDFDDLV
jgi:hypothetical protein